MQNEFQPIQGVPGYEINGLGQVRGRSGRILRHDPDGRVQLNTPRGPRRFFVGELMLPVQASGPAPEQPQNDRADLLRKIDHLERVIAEHEAMGASFNPFGGAA